MLTEQVQAVGASVFSVRLEVQSVAEGIEALDARLSWVETNVSSITGLLCDFVSSVRELREAFPVAGRSMKPAGHEPEATPGSSSVPPGEGAFEPAGREPEEMPGSSSITPGEGAFEPAGHEPEEMPGSSRVPPGEGEVKPAGRDPEVTSGSSDIPPGDKKQDDGDDVVIIRTKATGPSAVPLSPHRPKKIRKATPLSPPTTTFFSGEETEEEVPLSKVPTPKKEVPLSKVPTPKKSRPFANMAMPQQPLAGKDGLWRCNICNV